VEGRQEEGVALILRQLQKRCGTLGSPVTEQITRLSLLQLEALGEALLEFRGLADLEEWLVTQGPREGLVMISLPVCSEFFAWQLPSRVQIVHPRDQYRAVPQNHRPLG
jgi:uncharacterized protein DUF4351